MKKDILLGYKNRFNDDSYLYILISAILYLYSKLFSLTLYFPTRLTKMSKRTIPLNLNCIVLFMPLTSIFFFI